MTGSFFRQLPFFGFLLLATFVLLMMLFYCYRKRTSLVTYNLSFVILALALGEFWLWASTMGREQSNSYREGSYTTNHWISDKELGLGFILTPGPREVQSIKRYRSGELIYNVTYAVNAVGLREVAHNGSGPPVFFFGDSFTFGEGVSDADTLPAQFARISGDSVFNFGVHGYGAHHFLRMLEIARPEQLGIRKEHPLVIFTLLLTHVDRAAGRAPWDPDGPLYEQTPNGLVFRGSFQRNILDRIVNKSYIYKVVEQILSEGKNRERLLAILEAANKIVSDRYGTNMLVIVWDGGPGEIPQYDADRVAWIKDRLAKDGIQTLFVSQMKPPLNGVEYYIAGDGHPNGTAYAALAQNIFDYCHKVDCLRHP